MIEDEFDAMMEYDIKDDEELKGEGSQTTNANIGEEYMRWLDTKPKVFLSYKDWLFTYKS